MIPITPKIDLWIENGRWRILFLFLGAALLAGWIFIARPADFTAPLLATDDKQERLNSVAPATNGRFFIQQTITPSRDGLREVELLLARSTDATESNGRFFIQLFDAADTLIAEESREGQMLSHNQSFILRFPPQPHSANQTYSLRISSEQGNRISLWGYDMDVYAGGEMSVEGQGEVPQTAVSDLRFITRYQLTAGNLPAMLAKLFRESGLIMLLALLFLPLPGLILLLSLPRLPRLNVWAWMGVALAVGTAVWPLIWQAWTLVGGHFTPILLWLLFVSGWLAVIFLWIRRPPALHPLQWGDGLLLLLLCVGFIVRLLAVRDLAFPPWVDASRHALITAVMVANGQIISDYAPYLPEITRFPYHFGFHTLSSSLILMGGWPLETLLLYLGVLLNALVPLTIYAAVSILTRRRWAALLAAMLVALPFFFPAYYATWGRMTQLTAVLTLPVLLILNWKLMAGGRRWRSAWPLVGILAAGLFYLHIRVFLIYLPFAAIVFIVLRGRNGRRLIYAALLGGALAAPRIFYLLNAPKTINLTSKGLTNYNAFPTNYVTVGWEQPFLYVAAIVATGVLIGGVRGKRWALLPFVLMAWAASLFLLLSGSYLGLPETWLLNLNSMYISLFVPLAIFLGITAVRLERWSKGQHWLLQILGLTAVGGTIAALILFGVRQQIGIINPETVLMWRGDVPIQVWAEENIPSDAHVAVNSWLWLGGTYAGNDGGAWLVPLTGLSSTTPPADYIYNRAMATTVNEFNKTATAVSDWSDPVQADWLRQQGVTHVLIGQRGGFFDPSELNQNPNTDLIYAHDGTFVFHLKFRD